MAERKKAAAKVKNDAAAKRRPRERKRHVEGAERHEAPPLTAGQILEALGVTNIDRQAASKILHQLG